MTNKLIRLTETDLHNIVEESVKQILNEAYNSDLYHFTNLEGLYGILESNCLSLSVSADDDYDDSNEVICLSRTGNPYIGYCPNTDYDLIFRLTLDTNKMLSSIRNIKITPWSMNNPRTTLERDYWKGTQKYKSVSDYEERLYNNNIKPLNKYCKSIDVFPLYQGEKFDSEQKKILKQLKNDFPQWKKIFNFGYRRKKQ